VHFDRRRKGVAIRERPRSSYGSAHELAACENTIRQKTMADRKFDLLKQRHLKHKDLR